MPLLLSSQVLAQLPSDANQCQKAIFTCGMNTMIPNKTCLIAFDQSGKTPEDELKKKLCLCEVETGLKKW